MRKALKALALTISAAALCGTLIGCESVKNVATRENLVKTMYIYSPDGKLLDKGEPDSVTSSGYNAQVTVRMHGKRYITSWANAVLVEEQHGRCEE